MLSLDLFGSADRSTYANETGVSVATASADLRRLVDAGLLQTAAAGRSTAYRPTPRLRELAAEG